MAKMTISIPFLLREIVSQLEQGLQLKLGVPMNAELPIESEEPESKGMAKIHFPGVNFKVWIEMCRGHFGLHVRITAVQGKAKSSYLPDNWINIIQLQSGPTPNSVEGDGERDPRFKFEFGGKRWARLSMNASNRANGLPEFEWNDTQHPWTLHGIRIGDLNYPNLPE